MTFEDRLLEIDYANDNDGPVLDPNRADMVEKCTLI